VLAGTKVLVTGAGGFIGSHLCEKLLAVRAEVTAMIRYSSRADWGNLEHLQPQDKCRLDVIAGDIQDSDFVMRSVAGKDVVFHLAALIAIPYSYVAPRSYFRTNVEGTLNVLEACRNHRTSRIVHTSSSEVYGSARYTPIDEKHALQGQSPYSASKIGADKIVESYVRSFDMPAVTVRPFNTFGPRQSARAVIPTIISQAVARDFISLGALGTCRDLTFVCDTVDGLIAAATAGPQVLGEEINLGTGKSISVGDLARRILKVMGTSKTIVPDRARIRPVGSEVTSLLSDNSKARELLDWAPKISLDDGLMRTIKFIRSHQSIYRHEAYVM
jgi:NAD dependent epimerase/dehydratase